MPRIQPVNPDTAAEATSEVLTQVKQKMGKVPNILGTMAHSPAAAKAYLAFSGTVAQGELSPPLRERIALAVGQANRCNYCLSAHSAIGKGAGLSEEDILQARQGAAADPKDAAVLAFAQTLVEKRGLASDADLDELRAAGLGDGEIIEVVANVALNLFTNYFNHVADPDVDFPLAPKLEAMH